MEIAEKKTIRFTQVKRDFTNTLNRRVSDYFKQNNLDRHGNAAMYIKTIFMFALYFVPFSLIVTSTVTNMWGLIGLVVLMGLGTAGIGLSIMHDANHGSYSSKRWVNQLMGYSLNLVGGNAFNWKVQHNVLHHSFTNVHEEDEDISPRGVLRMTPHSDWKPIHKYQHFYAWPLYGLMTIVWIFVKDFVRIVRYNNEGFVTKQRTTAFKEWTILLLTKAVFIGYIFVLPVLLTDLAWWQVLTGIMMMHYVAGFTLAIIFQPAHVVEETDFPLPDEHAMMKDDWTVHQLKTTTNFGNKSRWFSWFIGGLNFQIEHHLFPNVCHVHYRKISKIVRSTAEEFGMPYYSTKTFMGALGSHYRLLKKLGKKPQPAMVFSDN